MRVFEETFKDNVEIKKLLFFNCSKNVMTERIMERAKKSGRVDDNPESIKKRLEVYENDTIPVVENFKKRKNCLEVNAEQEIDIVFKNIKNKLLECEIYPPKKSNFYIIYGKESKQ